MGENSKIEWTDSTWNFLVGCDKVSAGCKNCYAIQTSWIRQHNAKMTEKFDGVVEKTPGGQLNWTGRVNVSEDALFIPLRKKKPTKYFVNSLSDLFHDNVPFEVVDRAFAVMAIGMQHTYQILTKRAKRMVEYFSREGFRDFITSAIADMAQLHGVDYDLAASASLDIFENGFPLQNVHIGVSVEDQNSADERIPLLFRVPAAVRFLSCEPLLGPLNLEKFAFAAQGITWIDVLDWIIVGGESGPGARPMHRDWARSIRDHCVVAGVPFFFKQWGDWVCMGQEPAFIGGSHIRRVVNLLPDGSEYTTGLINPGDIACMLKVGKKAAGRLLDGIEHNEFPNP